MAQYRILLKVFTRCSSQRHFIPHFIPQCETHYDNGRRKKNGKNKTRQININSQITLLLWFDNCVYRLGVETNYHTQTFHFASTVNFLVDANEWQKLMKLWTLSLFFGRNLLFLFLTANSLDQYSGMLWSFQKYAVVRRKIIYFGGHLLPL